MVRVGRLNCWIYESDTEESGHLKLELKVTQESEGRQRDPGQEP